MNSLRMSISIFSLMNFAKNKGFAYSEAESIGIDPEIRVLVREDCF